MKTIGILTSGGDSPGMNAAIRAVTRTAKHKGLKVLGVERGYEGLMAGQFIELGVHSVSDIMQRGGTFLKSARSEAFKTPEGLNAALEEIRDAGMDALVVIGGDGSFEGASRLIERGVQVIGIPGTIDNDMGYTERTLGFDTAVNTAVEAVGKIRDTSAAHERITVVEVMGRQCGDIALYTAISCGAEVVLLPEREMTVAEICARIEGDREQGRLHSIIVNAEGSGFDTMKLAGELEAETGAVTRGVILGYLLRGGSPTPIDRVMAGSMGHLAVEQMLASSSSFALGVRKGRLEAVPFEEALRTERTFDEDMYNLVSILSLYTDKNNF